MALFTTWIYSIPVYSIHQTLDSDCCHPKLLTNFLLKRNNRHELNFERKPKNCFSETSGADQFCGKMQQIQNYFEQNIVKSVILCYNDANIFILWQSTMNSLFCGNTQQIQGVSEQNKFIFQQIWANVNYS